MKPRVAPILGLFFFCVLFLLLTKLLVAGSFARFSYPGDALLYLFGWCLFSLYVTRLIKRQVDGYTRRSTDFSRYLLLSAVSALLCATLATAFMLGIESWLVGKSHRTFDYLVNWLFFFTFFAFVINTYITYLYLGDLSNMRENLLVAQRAQAETQLKLLQQKVDPHFLFNNLNVLSALIERNPEAASEFVTRFTRLYRYILQHVDAEIVPLDEELAFARDYIFLLEQRFGQAYRFDLPPAREQTNGHLIIPAALQGLIENAVKHNEGSAREPLSISIAIHGDYLTVSNQLRPKSQASDSAGTGLENLQARYRLMTDRLVEISCGERNFTVKLPLLKVVNT